MKRPAVSLVLFVVATSATVSGQIAQAQDAATAAPGAGRRSLIGLRCKDDAAKLCAGIEPGGGKLARCLHGHEGELSEPCKAALMASWPSGKASAAPAGTGTTAASPAAAVPAAGMGGHGGGMMGMGMGMGMGQAGEWGAMKKMRKTCAADGAKLCKDVKPGHGRLAVCLNEHPNEVSPACKKVVGEVISKMNAPMETHADCAADAQKLCSDVPAGVGRMGFCLGEHSAELSPACKTHMTEMKGHWKKHGAGQGSGGAGGAPGVTPVTAPPVPKAAPGPAAPMK